VDLVAPAAEDVHVESHFTDSLLALDALPSEARRLIDVGAGGGFPGMVWALVRPDLEVVLAEPRGRRATFLRTVIRETGAENALVAEERDEDLPAEGFDVAVSRATFPYEEWLPRGARLVRPGGVVLALLGRRDPAGLRASEGRAGLEVEGIHSYELPTSGARRRVVVLRRAPA